MPFWSAKTPTSSTYILRPCSERIVNTPQLAYEFQPSVCCLICVETFMIYGALHTSQMGRSAWLLIPVTSHAETAAQSHFLFPTPSIELAVPTFSLHSQSTQFVIKPNWKSFSLSSVAKTLRVLTCPPIRYCIQLPYNYVIMSSYSSNYVIILGTFPTYNQCSLANGCFSCKLEHSFVSESIIFT